MAPKRPLSELKCILHNAYRATIRLPRWLIHKHAIPSAFDMATRFCILGTAGHIDHGKSSLVTALTGTDPDRLPEEKVRGMTIELGFAHLHLPSEDNHEAIDIGIVDVPGHERFIRTMVAGATGFDLAMLVVAADDGIMPQTREHIEILDLLGVNHGLIALSKVDLVPSDRIEDVRQMIAEAVAGTALYDWPIIPVSAKTGAGLDEIRSAIRTRLRSRDSARGGDVFRLAIDRVFTIHGRGLVATGSVLSGCVAPGATLELMPAAVTVRVREVQSHGSVTNGAVGGQRAAINLTGVEKQTVRRGMELATPGYLAPSRYVDARVRILPRLDAPFTTHRRVRVSIGTTEAMAMFVVIGEDSIAPGMTGLAQLRFIEPVVASFGQRFILRNESAQATIGGGRVVRPVSRRVRPKSGQTLEQMSRAADDDPYIRACEAVRSASFECVAIMRLACQCGLSPAEVESNLERMRREGLLVSIGGREVHREAVHEIERRVAAFLMRHHANRPAEPGVQKDRLIGWTSAKSAEGLGRDILDSMTAGGQIVVRGPYIAHRDYQPAMSPEDAEVMSRIVREIADAGFDPPEWSKLRAVAGLPRQRAAALEDIARTDTALVPFAPHCFIASSAIDRFKSAVEELGRGGRRFKLAEVRDKLNLTRRVVQPLLEHLDRTRYTRRLGDERVLMEPK